MRQNIFILLLIAISSLGCLTYVANDPERTVQQLVQIAQFLLYYVQSLLILYYIWMRISESPILDLINRLFPYCKLADALLNIIAKCIILIPTCVLLFSPSTTITVNTMFHTHATCISCKQIIWIAIMNLFLLQLIKETPLLNRSQREDLRAMTLLYNFTLFNVVAMGEIATAPLAGLQMLATAFILVTASYGLINDTKTYSYLIILLWLRLLPLL